MDNGPGARSRSQRRRLPHRTYVAGGARPSLSMVVPAYNEEGRLSDTLPQMWQFLRSRFPTFELVVVNDGSTDGTAQVVESFAQGRPR